MIIATFGPTTEWAGKTITQDGDVFAVDGHGPLSATDIMEHDRQGHLVWADAGTRAWIGSRALTPAPRPALTLEDVTAKHLQAAEQQLAEGRDKKALDTLWYVVPGARTDPALAQGLLDLASAIRAKNDKRLQSDCDELIETARAAIRNLADDPTPQGIHIAFAKYIGGLSEAEPPFEGTLWVTTEAVSIAAGPGRREIGARVSMTSISSIGVDSEQVAKSKLLPVLAFGVWGGLAAKGSKDRTYLTAHTNEGEFAAYEVDSRSATEVRSAIAPTLRAAGVPFEDELPTQVALAACGQGVSAAAEIERLANLREKDMLTDEEFAMLKAKLME